MKIICIYAPGNKSSETRCNSDICPHRVAHDKGTLDESGGCQWAKDPHCVPCDKRDLLEELLIIHFPKDVVPAVADAIEAIYAD